MRVLKASKVNCSNPGVNLHRPSLRDGSRNIGVHIVGAQYADIESNV